jgi:hypothetical protein
MSTTPTRIGFDIPLIFQATRKNQALKRILITRHLPLQPELAPRLELDPLSFSFEMVAFDLELAFLRFLRTCR